MGLGDRVRRIDAAMGVGPREGEYRHQYLARLGRSRWPNRYVQPEVYSELVDLHDKVALLEAKVAALEARG